MACVLSDLAIELPKRDMRADLILAIMSWTAWQDMQNKESAVNDLVDHIWCTLTLQGWAFDELLSGTVLAFQHSDAADLVRGAVSNVFTDD